MTTTPKNATETKTSFEQKVRARKAARDAKQANGKPELCAICGVAKESCIHGGLKGSQPVGDAVRDAIKNKGKKSAPKAAKAEKSEPKKPEPAAASSGDQDLVRVLEGQQGWVRYYERRIAKLKNAGDSEGVLAAKKALQAREARVAALSEALANGKTLVQLNAERPVKNPANKRANLEAKIERTKGLLARLQSELAALPTE